MSRLAVVLSVWCLFAVVADAHRHRHHRRHSRHRHPKAVVVPKVEGSAVAPASTFNPPAPVESSGFPVAPQQPFEGSAFSEIPIQSSGLSEIPIEGSALNPQPFEASGMVPAVEDTTPLPEADQFPHPDAPEPNSQAQIKEMIDAVHQSPELSPEMLPNEERKEVETTRRALAGGEFDFSKPGRGWN